MDFEGLSKVEARKLEHEYPHALKLKYKGILALILLTHVPTFWGSLYSIVGTVMEGR